MKERIENLKKKGKPPRFALIYGSILFLATVVFAGLILYRLWWIPRVETGIPILGYRIEDIPEIQEAWLTETESFGGNQPHVDYVELFWNTGPVVYFNVRVEEGTSLSDARTAAENVVAHFIELTDEAALYYSLQVVVSYGDIVELRAKNREAVTAHTHEFNWSLTEGRLAHAENYPSQSNVSLASESIIFFANSIISVMGQEELDRMSARLEAIDVMTAEQEAQRVEEGGPIPVYAGVRQVPPSDISEFPNWGAWNNQRSSINWN